MEEATDSRIDVLTLERVISSYNAVPQNNLVFLSFQSGQHNMLGTRFHALLTRGLGEKDDRQFKNGGVVI